MNGLSMAASKFPPATREHHDTFCVHEKWELKRGAKGQPVAHHKTYVLKLWDGRILRTRISRPVNKTQYSPSMWKHILREQLEVDTATFWACVRNAELPDRGEPKQREVKKPIPLYLYRELTQRGVTDGEIAELDVGEAAELYAQLLRDDQQ